MRVRGSVRSRKVVINGETVELPPRDWQGNGGSGPGDRGAAAALSPSAPSTGSLSVTISKRTTPNA